MNDLTKLDEYARNAYDNANCTYDGKHYFTHIDMVIHILSTYENIFIVHDDYICTRIAASGHDLIEDARQTFNNISKVLGHDAATIILAVTDVPAENRLLRHLLTMGKTVRDYRAIILKMCDMHANATYSKSTNSRMYKVYVEEYEYRKPIFMKALTWYEDKLNQKLLEDFWQVLDIVHNKV